MRKMDMKPGQESQASMSRPATHRFPNFTDGGRISCTETSAADRHPFQPLFHGETASNTHPASDDRTADGNQQMEKARQRGYDNGFDAGRQDACRMADNLLAPHVEGFLKKLERLTSYQQYIADHASTHMLKLAVEISERIIGADAHVTVADLQALRPTLIEAICKRYELHLCYHPQDLSNLQHLMECKGENGWRTADGLNIVKDLNVSQGAMINGSEVEESLSIEDQVQPSLQQLLMNAESDRKL